MNTIPTLTDKQKFDIGVAASLAFDIATCPQRSSDRTAGYITLTDTVLTELAKITTEVETATEPKPSDVDPRVDPRPWEGPLTDPSTEVKKGDAVRIKVVSTWRDGIAHHQDENGDWHAKEGTRLTWGTEWPVYRIPALAPSLPTRDGARIIPPQDCKFIQTVGGTEYEWLVYVADAERWLGWDAATKTSRFVPADKIIPDTWQEVSA